MMASEPLISNDHSLMIKDPIVEEVRRAREELLAESGGKLEQLMDNLQQRESEERGVVVKSARELTRQAKALAS